MMAETQATERPWRLYLSGHISAGLGGDGPRTIAKMVFPEDKQSVIDGQHIVKCVNEYDSLKQRIAELESLNKRWKAAIEGLTPSGSEYVDDPEACATTIRQRTRWPKQIIEARQRVIVLEGALGELTSVAEFTLTTPGLIKGRGLLANRSVAARAALEGTDATAETKPTEE